MPSWQVSVPLLSSFLRTLQPLVIVRSISTYALYGLEGIFVEGVEHGAEVALARVGQERHHALALVLGARGYLRGGIANRAGTLDCPYTAQDRQPARRKPAVNIRSPSSGTTASAALSAGGTAGLSCRRRVPRPAGLAAPYSLSSLAGCT